MSERMQAAQEAWGDVPDWIEALVEACDATSQNKVAARLDRSATVISQVLRGTYPGNLDNVERRVRAVFLAEQVDCPALGPISSEDCLAWQDKAKEERATTPLNVTITRSCRRCPRFRNEEAADE
ncbi:MAG: hypothetical protein AAGM84_05455 [Pseudomonadota bacterium]